MKIAIALILINLSLPSWGSRDCAQSACIEELETVSAGPNEYCATCQAENFESSSDNKDASPNKTVINDPSCKQKYDRLFADGTVNTTIAVGYNDGGGTTTDSLWGDYIKQNTIQRLVSACPTSYELLPVTAREPESGGMDPLIQERNNGCGKRAQLSQTCGFKPTDDPEIFVKTIKDHNNKPVTVKVRILTSQLSSSDKLNRESVGKLAQKICKTKTGTALTTCLKANTPPQISMDALEKKCEGNDRFYFQPCRTRYVRESYKSSISNGDELVFYSGHARDGGGPSFEMPRVLSNGHVDYSWYRAQRPGHKMEVEALKAAAAKGKAPVFYGSYSCSSRIHFLDKGQLAQASPKTSYVLSNRLSYSDETLGAMLQTLDSALSYQCKDTFNRKTQEISCAFNLRRF